MIQNGQCWAFREEAEAVTAGAGFVRRVLAYNDELLCVENSFEQGAPHRSTAIPIPRQLILLTVYLILRWMAK